MAISTIHTSMNQSNQRWISPHRRGTSPRVSIEESSFHSGDTSEMIHTLHEQKVPASNLGPHQKRRKQKNLASNVERALMSCENGEVSKQLVGNLRSRP